MKQITIDDLIPFMRKGWICCDTHGSWMWFRKKPYVFREFNFISTQLLDFPEYLPRCLNIAPYKGDWKDSLRRVK